MKIKYNLKNQYDSYFVNMALNRKDHVIQTIPKAIIWNKLLLLGLLSSSHEFTPHTE